MRRLPYLLLLLFFLMGCGLPTRPEPATVILVTANPAASSTATPFQPAPATLAPSPVPPSATPLIPTATATSQPTLTPIPSPIDLPTSFPTPDLASADRPQYLLYLTLDYANKSASVQELVAYTNNTDETLTDIVLAVEPGMWQDCFYLDGISVDGLASDNYDLRGQRLTVVLTNPLAPGARLTLGVNYELIIPYKSQSQVFGYNSAQINLVDWFPFIVPYQLGSGWILHEPWPFGEHLVLDPADYEVNLRFADPTSAPIVAASAPPESAGEWTRFRLQNARTFVLSASPYFQVASALIGSVNIQSYYFSGDETAGAAILTEVGQAVDIFSSLFAPYPYPGLSIVETNYYDGMEYDGLIFLSSRFYETYDGTPQNNLITIGVHESAHMWWYGLVGNDQAMDPWLDEALATYSERIFYERAHPDLVTWWWNFRVHNFDPVGYVDTNIYNSGSFRSYTNSVYLVGAYFLEDLRYRMGDDAFFIFLPDYASQMSHRRADPQDFFRILREHTGADLSDLLINYFINHY